ncbi:MAG TPA: phosphatase PAP2 family protein [Mycobacteriales bacterium]|nr:phosphatase PAP2 family protein [Mycobacteriales bacterium]
MPAPPASRSARPPRRAGRPSRWSGRLPRWAGRLDPDQRYELRLTLAVVGAVLLGVPFLLLLLAVQGAWSPLLRLDRSVAEQLHALALRSPLLVHLLDAVSTVFAPLVFRLAATVLAGWLLLRRRTRLAAWALVTTWGAALLGVLLKEAVARARPSFVDAVAAAPGRSFPSGHALGSVVGCGVLLLVLLPLLPRWGRRLAWFAAGVVVAAVGFARVGLGVHYLSDVLAGWVLGLGLLAGTVAAFESWRREIGASTPEPVAGLEPELATGQRVRPDHPG